MKLLLRQALGLILLIIGIAGLLLPVIPGVVFILLALAVLGSRSRVFVTLERFIRRPSVSNTSGGKKSAEPEPQGTEL
jgi:uncharacterized membrane protein YbaN (DUF454 family)